LEVIIITHIHSIHIYDCMSIIKTFNFLFFYHLYLIRRLQYIIEILEKLFMETRYVCKIINKSYIKNIFFLSNKRNSYQLSIHWIVRRKNIICCPRDTRNFSLSFERNCPRTGMVSLTRTQCAYPIIFHHI